jgi:DNA invertase Pin-like site-specific DNA recombinase
MLQVTYRAVFGFGCLFQEAIISSILAMLAKQECIRLSERSKAGMARRRTQGVQIGLPTKNATVINRIRELKKRGLSNYAISKALLVKLYGYRRAS